MKKAIIFAAILGLMGLTLCFSCTAQETTPIGSVTGPVSSPLALTIFEIRNYNTDELKNLYERPEYLRATEAIVFAIQKQKQETTKWTSGDVFASIKDAAAKEYISIQRPRSGPGRSSVESDSELTLNEIKNYSTYKIEQLYERPEYLCATEAILKAIEKYITLRTDWQRSCERIKIEATNNAFQKQRVSIEKPSQAKMPTEQNAHAQGG